MEVSSETSDGGRGYKISSPAFVVTDIIWKPAKRLTIRCIKIIAHFLKSSLLPNHPNLQQAVISMCFEIKAPSHTFSFIIICLLIIYSY